MEISLEPFAELIYTLPSSFLILAGREWFRNFLFRRLANAEVSPALAYVDPFAVVVTSIWGVSWAGLNQAGRRDNILTFVASQCWYIAVIATIIAYYHLHNPAPGSYLSALLPYFVHHSYALLLFNLLPIPPFDASCFYVQPWLRASGAQIAMAALKVAIVGVLVFDLVDDNLLKADFLVQRFMSPN